MFLEQNQLRLARADEFVHAEREGRTADQIGRHIYLTSSFVGGSRYKMKNLEDAMALAMRHGPPTFFITLTCNPIDPEITSRLRPGETAYTRPDITCRVFHQLLQRTLVFIREWLRPLGILYDLHVIEFQKRGLPHAHILIRTERAPSMEEVPEWISAEMPNEDEDPELHRLVSDFMMHRCSAEHCLQHPRNDGRCKRRFPADLPPGCYIDEAGYPHYRRRSEADRYIVPYSPALLRFTRCHTNVEILTGAKVIGYVFKCKCIYKHQL